VEATAPAPADGAAPIPAKGAAPAPALGAAGLSLPQALDAAKTAAATTANNLLAWAFRPAVTDFPLLSTEIFMLRLPLNAKTPSSAAPINDAMS
jgi:hypothetical protein